MGKTLKLVALQLTKKDIKRFLSVPHTIYAHDPNWVAPLLRDKMLLFLPGNPFLKHAEIALWVAVQDGQDMGSIAAIVDHNYNAFHKENTACFGFFECVNDPDVAKLLLDTAVAWARAHGASQVLGPLNPSTNEECGLLVEGYQCPPTLMMPYNPPYYPELMEANGFTKAKDLLAFFVDVQRCPLDRLGRIAERTLRRNPALKLKPVTLKTLESDLAKIKSVYNRAWELNWGFVPMTDSEFEFMARRLKPVFMEGLVWYALWEDEPVGFMLALPDYNLVLRHLRGRIISPGLVRALPYLLGWRTPHRCRVVTLGVIPPYRNRGIEAALLVEGFKHGIQAGITEAEASWVLEDNTAMCRVMGFFEGQVYRRYRIYTRTL